MDESFIAEGFLCEAAIQLSKIIQSYTPLYTAVNILNLQQKMALE